MPTRKSYLVGLPFIHKNAVFGVIFVREGNVTALIIKWIDTFLECLLPAFFCNENNALFQ